MTGSRSPPSKRAKLELVTTPRTNPGEEVVEDGNNCSICLQAINDQTVLPSCSHEFCFECLLIWTKQSRRCPLCSRAIGEYLIHNIRTKHDYSKHYLVPLRTSPIPARLPVYSADNQEPRARTFRRRPTARDRERERREREELAEVDRLQRSISKRRWVYRHGLYAKHVASNTYTRYKPYPFPAQFSASQELLSRTTSFIRRELQVWPNLDIEFLTTFTISIMKSIDIRSESAVKLLAEFLDMDIPYVEGGRHVNAEHFAHEIYCFVRSPYKDIFVYDNVVQYDVPSHVPPPPSFHRRRRWRTSHSRSRSFTRSSSDSRTPRSSARSRSASLHDSPVRFHCDPHIPSPSQSPLSPQYPITDDFHGPPKISGPISPAREIASQQVETVSQSYSTHRANQVSDASSPVYPPSQATRSMVSPTYGDRKPQEDLRPHDELCEPPTLGPHNVVAAIKGRQQAHDSQVEANKNAMEGRPSKPDIKMQHEGSSESLPSSSAQPRVGISKLPRNRSLRDCVEAHLGGGKRKFTAGGRCGERLTVQAKERDPGADNTAASLSGSFNSILPLTDQASAEIKSRSNCRDVQNGGPIAITDSQDSHVESTLSFVVYGDVSQRPHPSFAPFQSGIISGQESAMLAIETSPQVTIIPRDIDHVGTGWPGHAINNIADCHRGSRSQLLSRLKEEKDRAYAKSEANPAKTSGELQLASAADNLVDSLQVEEQLRKKARLRMKLAAEKRGIP